MKVRLGQLWSRRTALGGLVLLLPLLMPRAGIAQAPGARVDVYGFAMLDMGYQAGQYALANLLFTPTPGMMVGGELQYGRRENNNDGWTVDDFRVQVSFKYNFSISIGGTR